MEKLQLLSGLLKTQCGNPENRHPFPDTTEIADHDWAASHFFFNLLPFVKLPPRPTITAFRAFGESFFEKTGCKIDLESLLKKHWVRLFGGEIRVAQQIKNQFFYFREYGKDKPKPAFWEKYETELRFLFDFEEQHVGEGSIPIITKSKFLELAEKHRAVFPKMPDWAFSECENEWFTETSTGDVALNYPRNALNPYFSNEIAIRAWNELWGKRGERNLAELLETWEERILKNRFEPRSFLQKLTFEARNGFLDAIFQRLENETDLLGSEHEIQKAKLDWYHPDRGDFSPDELPDFVLRGKGLFEKYLEIERMDSIQDDFYYQPARADLYFFLREILALESALNHKVWETNALKNAERLLALCPERPALLFAFCELTKKEYPEALPVFFRNKETLSLGCRLVQSVSIRPEILPEQRDERFLSEQKVRSGLFQSAVEIALAHISLQHNPVLAGKTFCEILLPVSNCMFHKRGYERFSAASEFQKRYQNAWGLLNTSRSRSDFHFLQSPSALADFAQGFLDCLENRLVLPVQNNSKIFDLPVLALLASLLRTVRFGRKGFSENEALEKMEATIAQTFVEFYQNEFSQSEIDVLNLKKTHFTQGDARWIWEPDFLDFFDFDVISTFGADLFEKFLDSANPEGFKKIPPDDTPRPDDPNDDEFWRLSYEDKVRSEKIKFRTHFRFVLRLYRALAAQKMQAKFADGGWKKPEKNLRKKLLIWAKFNRDDEAAGVFNLFDPLLENFNSWQHPLPVLVQDIAQTINFFPKEKHRTAIVETLSEGVFDLDFLLKIHNHIECEASRKLILNRIQSIDVESFIQKQFAWNPIESALIEATNGEGFVQIAERLLAFVEANGARRETFFGLKFSRFVLEIKSILAYRKGDRALMAQAFKEFEKHVEATAFAEIEPRRQFFEAIFLQSEKRFAEAAKIWERLALTDNSVEIHYRKLFAQIMAALQETDEQQAVPKINGAWQVWEKFQSEKQDKTGLEKFNEGIVFCRMAWLNAYEADAEFDFFKCQLSQSTLLDMDVLRLVLINQARRGKDLEASRLISEARRHFLTDSAHLDELNSLQKLFDPTAQRNAIALFFKDLAVISLEDLVQVVPHLPRKHRSVHGFLLHEILFVAEELMKKITALDEISPEELMKKTDLALKKAKELAKEIEIKKENKYNDLFTVLLRARLSFLGFEINDQPREGKSLSRKDAGELDLTFRFAGRNVAVYEAFILRDEKRIVEHLTKVFGYDPTGKLFFTVVFYKNADKNFAKKFETYKEIVLNKPFPTGCELQNGFEKVDDFSKPRNVFLGKTTHGAGEDAAEMFHVFMNLSY